MKKEECSPETIGTHADYDERKVIMKKEECSPEIIGTHADYDERKVIMKKEECSPETIGTHADYDERKKALLDNLETYRQKLDNQTRFIRCIVSGDIKIIGREAEESVRELQENGFTAFPKKTIENGDHEETKEASNRFGGYDYLLSMPIMAINLDRANELRFVTNKIEKEMDRLRGSTPSSLYK